MKNTSSVFKLLHFSCLLFIISTAIAMLFFPGGTMLDHNTKGYSFFNNFFSELGRWRTLNGESKWISFFGFEIALLFQSFAMFVFNIKFLEATNSKQLNKTVYYTAIVCGSIFPFLLAGIAFTPCDLYLPYHMDFVYTAFGILVPLSLAYTILIRQHHLLPNKYGNAMLIIVIAITIYLFIMLFGPDPHYVGYVQQTTQKVIVYSMIFSLLYLAQGCKKYLSVVE